MECQYHSNCGGWCETEEELEMCLCCHCLDAEHDGRHDEVLPRVEPGRRKDRDVDGEQQHEHQRDPEVRYRKADEGQEAA